MSDRQTPVVFTGKAEEYFGIWIVNLLLSIVTLGIYSAWAKVRRNKYFYNNTLIDGVGFDYHANPIAILKGRVIAVALFILYQVLAGFSPAVAAVLLVAFLIALPWIVIRGLTFNARNSSHRGLRFDFDGKYGQAALAFIVYPILIVVTLGLALPFVSQRVNKFAFDHHKFGTSHFQMQASVKDFYKVYLKLLAVLIAVGLAVSLVIGSLASSLRPDQVSWNQSQHAQPAHIAAENSGFMKVAAPAEEFSAEDYLQDLSPEERAEFEAQMKAYEAQMQQADGDYAMESQQENPFDKLTGPLATLGALLYVVIFAVIVLYMAAIFAISAYIKSRIGNLIWNNTALEQVRFFSNQRTRDLVWLYLSNAVVLMFTLGLATPWAQIRLARYRAERLALVGETNWEKFIGEKKQSSRAVGEEIAEMFDVDLSFG